MNNRSEPSFDDYEQQIAGVDSAMEWMRDTLPEVAANIDRAFAPLSRAFGDAARAAQEMRLPRFATETGAQA